MSWIILTIFAALLTAISNIVDRYLLKHETNNPKLLTELWGLISSLVFCTPALFQQNINFNWTISLGGILIGSIYLFSMLFYYTSVSQAEISRIVPILAINPIIVLIFATILFQEIFHSVQYFGIFLIILGILISSYRGKDKRILPFQAILYLLIAASGFATKNIITKALSFQVISPLNLLFWIGIGTGLASLLFFIPKLQEVLKLSNRKFLHYFTNLSLSAFASLLFTLAITTGPVALVTFLHRLEILFVFILAESINFLYPQALQEKNNKKIFFQKFIAVIIILVGCYFLI